MKFHEQYNKNILEIIVYAYQDRFLGKSDKFLLIMQRVCVLQKSHSKLIARETKYARKIKRGYGGDVLIPYFINLK